MEILPHMTETAHHSIFPLGDLHLGNPEHNSDALKLAISYIIETAKHRTVDVCLLGDIVDCISISDKRFNPAEIASHYKIKDLSDLPKKQADEAIKILSPIKDLLKGRWAVIGNHEVSYIKMHYFDVFSYYCEKLGLNKLNKFGIILKSLKCPKSTSRNLTKIGMTHPANAKGLGGVAPGYEIRSVINIFRAIDVNVGIIGHWHHMSTKPISTLSINKVNNITSKKKWYGANGCFMNTYSEGCDGYAEGKPGDLSDIGMLEIRYDRGTNSNNWDYDIVPRFF